MKFRDKIIEDIGLSGQEAVLDAGCGTGVLIRRIKERFPGIKVTGLDPTASALAIAGRKSREKHLTVQWVEGVGEAMPFPDSSFDRVVTSLAFHHIPAGIKAAMLREALRVLRPGGKIVLVDFSEAGSPTAKFLFFWMIRLEHVKDQLGRLGNYLENAGFARVKLKRRYHFGVCSFTGTKPSQKQSSD